MSERLDREPGAYTVEYDPELGAIVVEWQDDVGGTAYRSVMEDVLGYLREYEATKLLVDACEQGTMDPDDQTWTVDEWVPRAVEAGLEHEAAVYPDAEPAKSSVDRYARRDPYVPVQRVFTADRESAREWLRGR